jgi:hypothetical protein
MSDKSPLMMKDWRRTAQEYAGELRDTRAAFAASTAREAALRDALRRYMIRDFCAGTPQTECLECRGHWMRGHPESHAPGCLAALPAAAPSEIPGTVSAAAVVGGGDE